MSLTIQLVTQSSHRCEQNLQIQTHNKQLLVSKCKGEAFIDFNTESLLGGSRNYNNHNPTGKGQQTLTPSLSALLRRHEVRPAIRSS